jgi:aminoglycoside phosphotransferase (APT) family kinase protein
MVKSFGVTDGVTQVKRLTGGLECDTFSFTLADRHLVMKLFSDGVLQARTEFENLSIVAAASVPTPDPILFDDEGKWFGSSTLVMSALPGAPELHPADVDTWTRGAATALASVHEIKPRTARTLQSPRWQRWQPSLDRTGPGTPRIERALDVLYASIEKYPTVFSHDDYNPGNVLFLDGALTGVVDWSDVVIEPRQAAVALFRHLLALHPGGDAPQRFLAHYESITRMSLADIALWDVLYGLRGMQPVEHWVRAYKGMGVTMTSEQIDRRSRRWITTALDRAEI